MWDAATSVTDRDLMRAANIAEPVLELAPPTEADDIVADYRHIGLTLGRQHYRSKFFPTAAYNPRSNCLMLAPVCRKVTRSLRRLRLTDEMTD